MQSDDAVSALGALAQSDRLAAYRLIVGAGAGGMASGDIAKRLGVQPTRMSFHLTALERVGLVTSRRIGRFVHYTAKLETMRALLGYLSDDCCGGHPEVCGVLLTPSGKVTFKEVS